MRNDCLYLDHILERIELTETFTADGYEAFMRSRLTQEAVIRNFEVIGEAVRRISEQNRQQYAHIPWQRMAGLRNVLIHDYDHIDLDRVWDIVEHQLPLLKPQIESMLRELEHPLS